MKPHLPPGQVHKPKTIVEVVKSQGRDATLTAEEWNRPRNNPKYITIERDSTIIFALSRLFN